MKAEASGNVGALLRTAGFFAQFSIGGKKRTGALPVACGLDEGKAEARKLAIVSARGKSLDSGMKPTTTREKPGKAVEPFIAADGTTYYRARILLGDGSRTRVTPNATTRQRTIANSTLSSASSSRTRTGSSSRRSWHVSPRRALWRAR